LRLRLQWKVYIYINFASRNWQPQSKRPFAFSLRVLTSFRNGRPDKRNGSDKKMREGAGRQAATLALRMPR